MTRCYGSLTTFNILFKNKDEKFRTGAEAGPLITEVTLRNSTRCLRKRALFSVTKRITLRFESLTIASHPLQQVSAVRDRYRNTLPCTNRNVHFDPALVCK
jgi:hypothetical protein